MKAQSWKRALIGSIGIIALAPVFVFLANEQTRARLLDSYAPPEALISDLLAVETLGLQSLLRSNESLVCALGSYGSAEHLTRLTPMQQSSIPKSKLPSEDGAWYLMFFSAAKAERIYLIPSFGDRGVELHKEGCASAIDRFEVRKQPGEERRLLFIDRGGN